LKKLGLELIFRNVQDTIDEEKWLEGNWKKYSSRNSLQTITL